MQKIDMKSPLSDEFSLEDFTFSLIPGDRIFFYGDLGAGKSTFIRYLLRKHFDNPTLTVRSPTYTYYEKYTGYPPIYHMDLYRLDSYDAFVSIGGDEIAEDRENIMLIEWPQIVEGYIQPTKVVRIEILEDGGRKFSVS